MSTQSGVRRRRYRGSLVMGNFIHQQNLAHYRRLLAEAELATSEDEIRHSMLMRLLAEEETNGLLMPWTTTGRARGHGPSTEPAFNGTYVRRATDAATYPTQSPGDAGAEPSCASGSRDAGQYGSSSKFMMVWRRRLSGQVEIQVEIAGAQRRHLTV